MPRKKVAKPNPRNHHLALRGRLWWCIYIANGRKQATPLRTDDVATAREKRDVILAAAADARAGIVAPPPPTVRLWEDAVDGWLALATAKARTDGQRKTLRRYILSVAQLSDALEGTPLSEVASGTVIDFVEARREQGRAAQTVKNDLTAWSRVLEYAKLKGWMTTNPARDLDRTQWIGSDEETIFPPEDDAVADLIRDIASWSTDMATFVRWLRETGMRSGEALAVQAEDVHPCGKLVTLRRGVKHNKRGSRTRTIALGRAAAMLAGLPKQGRLFPGLHLDSSVVSTRYGQWHRQRQAREDRIAAAEGRLPVALPRFRLHDLRHGFAIASILDDSDCIYRLQKHMGHTVIAVTEGYLRFLEGEGSQRSYGRRPDLFGSLSSTKAAAAKAA